MSTIKVDTIQSRQHSTSTINLTSTGATVNGDCTATTFSGSGASLTSLPAANLTGTLPALSAANLTSIPAANLTGTLPAIDGSNLTGVGGGGAYEFVSKTVVSADAYTVSITGLSQDSYYIIIAKKISYNIGHGSDLTMKFLDSSGNAHTGSYIDVYRTGSSNAQYTDSEIGGYAGGSATAYEFYMQLNTTTNATCGIFDGRKIGANSRAHIYFQTGTTAVYGFQIYVSGSTIIQTGSTILVYKLKES